jgi:hypothetical protein
MKRNMRLILTVLIILTIISSAEFTAAQQQNEWIPQGIATLQQSAPSKTDFTFDHSMLVLASKLEPDNEDLRRVIAGVSGLSVHRYRFPGSGQYDPSILNSVGDEYRAAGWKQVMNNHEKGENPSATAIWVRLENNAISNVALLITKSTEVNFVVVSGSISPLDLSHLGGHFGIPKIEGGVVVPNGVPNNERRP